MQIDNKVCYRCGEDFEAGDLVTWHDVYAYKDVDGRGVFCGKYPEHVYCPSPYKEEIDSHPAEELWKAITEDIINSGTKLLTELKRREKENLK